MAPPMALCSVSWVLLSCLMLLSQVQGEDSPQGALASGINCPKGSKAYGSYCYAFFLTAKSWMDADGYQPDAGGWEWSSTDLMHYRAWEKSPATVSNPGYCGSVSRSTGYLKWKDYNCDSYLPYVCKFRA
uniref:C-type lectin domain-containing protein n=1 Tax=Equus caballus TaxID=9796 RepID=A0A5F5PP17_HORSE|nr:PREDICTED: regenerating islet-derived protein 3-gamma-like isoform X2 [Equus przewalskii]